MKVPKGGIIMIRRIVRRIVEVIRQEIDWSGLRKEQEKRFRPVASTDFRMMRNSR
ncbi:MAG: hypothetical protein ACOYL3_16265 [Desulfuromonadaceae bacterium]